MFKRFFSQDNATAKLASWLILLTSLVSSFLHVLQLPPSLDAKIVILCGVLTVIAHFFQTNQVIKTASWYLLAYALVDYLTTVEIGFPQSHEFLLALASFLKLATSFSNQTPCDPNPPQSVMPAGPIGPAGPAGPTDPSGPAGLAGLDRPAGLTDTASPYVSNPPVTE